MAQRQGQSRGGLPHGGRGPLRGQGASLDIKLPMRSSFLSHGGFLILIEQCFRQAAARRPIRDIAYSRVKLSSGVTLRERWREWRNYL